VFFAPVNWRLRSGDRVAFNVNPTGERLDEPFEVADGVTIAPGTYNVGRLPSGHFTQTLVGNRLRLNLSPDLSIASYVKYDSDSHSVGTNSRLRWTFRPAADLFIVYNHNVHSILDRWHLDSNQLLIKIQYSWRL